jgi:hypothetical protein
LPPPLGRTMRLFIPTTPFLFNPLIVFNIIFNYP